MKTSFLQLLLMLLFPGIALATVHTVSNLPSTLAQFNTIQAAVTAAADGDSIYVHGSPNVYAAFTQTNKRLTIIGPGWGPDKNFPFTAQIPGCTITGTACSNSEYQGLFFTTTISINSNKPDNLRFIRNRFGFSNVNLLNGSTTYAGYLFEGNYFDNAGVAGTSSSTYQNFIFQNNIFVETGFVGGSISGFQNTSNILIDHNLFYGPTGNTTRDAFGSNCNFLTITNNIFVKRNAANQNSFSTFNNNITFYPAPIADPGAPWLLNGNTNSGGNVHNTDPQMVAQAGVNAGTNNPLQDFTIAAGPANNSGSDGKDMGLLFDAVGSLNWANSRNSRLPRIFAMNVITPTVPAGGNVTINVDARVSN